MQTNRGNLAKKFGALITNEPKVKSEDVVEEKDEPHSVVEKEGNEEEEFYTLEELDDLENQSMAYIARKFSNIIFNKNKAFNLRQYTSTYSNNTGSKALYKGGYNTGSVDSSKIRCWNCNDLGNFVNECIS